MFKLITGPTAEPVTPSEAKLHLRVDHSDEDALIAALIVAARQMAEHETGRALMPQTWELYLDGFPCDDIRIGMMPIQSITSVKYYDTAGVLQTVSAADYVLDTVEYPGWIRLGYGKAWPATRDMAGCVIIRFVAGYADAATVPQAIKSWMLLNVGTLYMQRETFVIGTNAMELSRPFWLSLIAPYKINERVA